MRSSRVRRVKRTARKSISRALSRMNRSRGKGKSKRSKSKRSKRSLVEELRETLSLPELESDLGILSVQKKKKSKKSKKKKKKSKAWSAKLHGKGTKGSKGKKGKKSHKKKHKGKKMKGGGSPEQWKAELQRLEAKRMGITADEARKRNEDEKAMVACEGNKGELIKLYEKHHSDTSIPLETYAGELPEGCTVDGLRAAFENLRDERDVVQHIKSASFSEAGTAAQEGLEAGAERRRRWGSAAVNAFKSFKGNR